MALQPRLSITIPQQMHDDLMVKIADLKLTLKPFLHPLTSDERTGLAKMGDKTQPFVQKALEYAKVNNEFMSQSIDVSQWQSDFDGWEDLIPLKNQLTQLLSDIDDTVMLLGAEAYDPARWYYDMAKLAANRGQLSAKPIAEDLGKRFPGVKRKKPEVKAVL